MNHVIIVDSATPPKVVHVCGDKRENLEKAIRGLMADETKLSDGKFNGWMITYMTNPHLVSAYHQDGEGRYYPVPYAKVYSYEPS